MPCLSVTALLAPGLTSSLGAKQQSSRWSLLGMQPLLKNDSFAASLTLLALGKKPRWESCSLLLQEERQGDSIAHEHGTLFRLLVLLGDSRWWRRPCHGPGVVSLSPEGQLEPCAEKGGFFQVSPSKLSGLVLQSPLNFCSVQGRQRMQAVPSVTYSFLKIFTEVNYGLVITLNINKEDTFS